MAGRGRLSDLNKAKVPDVFGRILPTNAPRRSRRSRKKALFSDSSRVNSIMAKKQTGLIKRPYIATSLLFLVVLLLACSKGRKEPSVSVPADCQQFLDKYFDAWKSKDIATLQGLSYYLSPQDQSRLPAGSLELWRASKNKLVTQNFEQVTRDFGDFKGYEILRVKTTTISPQDQLAANTIGSGIHTELVCKARFSKKHDTHVVLHLIKETEGSQYIVAAWNFQAEL
jgi:hypothetical protein